MKSRTLMLLNMSMLALWISISSRCLHHGWHGQFMNYSKNKRATLTAIWGRRAAGTVDLATGKSCCGPEICVKQSKCSVTCLEAPFTHVSSMMMNMNARPSRQSDAIFRIMARFQKVAKFVTYRDDRFLFLANSWGCRVVNLFHDRSLNVMEFFFEITHSFNSFILWNFGRLKIEALTILGVCPASKRIVRAVS